MLTNNPMHNDESRLKMIKSKTGKKLGPRPQEVRDKISKSKTGVSVPHPKLSEERKRNIGLKTKGNKSTKGMGYFIDSETGKHIYYYKDTGELVSDVKNRSRNS